MKGSVKSIATTKGSQKAVAIPTPERLNYEMMAALAEKLPLDEVIDRLKDCMTATKTEYRKMGEVEVEDRMTQLGAIKVALAYHIGAPTMRQEITYKKEVDTDDLRAKLAKPGFAEAVIREFWPDKAEEVLKVIEG